MNTMLQIRIDKKTKEKAQKTFRQMGLDMSSGVKLYLAQVVNQQKIPFSVMSADYWPIEKKKKILREVKNALEHGRSYLSAAELHEDILCDR